MIKTFEVLPEYLKTKTRGEVNDYRDWGIPLGRRFRALKLWFVIRGFGINGIQQTLRRHIQLNEYFADQLRAHSDFELILEPFLNFTCFRLKPDHVSNQVELNELNEKLLENINHNGKLFMSHTKVKGIYAIRMVMAQTYLEKIHLETALNEIRKQADRLTV